MIKISVILAVFNGEKYLEQAIKSILNQTFKDFEFIIINDASKDLSKKIILSFSDKRIVYFENKNNIGLTQSLNQGIKIAQGQYIARMDADDISMPERLKCQYDFMEKNSAIGLIGSWAEAINEKGDKLNVIVKPDDDGLIKYSLFYYCPFLHSSIFFRKSLLAEIDFYNKEYEYAQDYEMYFRIASFTKFSNIKKVLLKYRTHPLSRSVLIKEREKQDKCASAVLKKNISKITKISPEEATRFFKINNNINVSWLNFLSYIRVYYLILSRYSNDIEFFSKKKAMRVVYFKYIKQYIKFKIKRLFIKYE